MPVVIDSRGVGIWVDDDQARDHAAHLLEDLAHKLTDAEQWGTPLTDADAQPFHEAERLLTEVGDVEDESSDMDPLQETETDDGETRSNLDLVGADQISPAAGREERDRRIAEVYAMYLALGGQSADGSVEAETFRDIPRLSETVSDKSSDVVGVRRDGEWWITYGRGSEYRVRDQATAEREAKRRVGWT